MGVTKRAVNKRADKEGWASDNGGANRTRRYLLSGLPAEVMEAVTKRDAVSLYNKDRDAGSLPVAVGDPQLTSWQNRRALARADLIRAYLNEKTKGKKERRATEAARLFITGYNTGQMMPKVYEILGPVAAQTVETWLREYRDANHDYAALAPAWGNRRGQRKVTDDEFNAILSFALHPNRLCVAEVIRLTKTMLERRNVPSPSSPDTLRRALIDWKNRNFDKWVFCREGEKALNDKCLPYLERDAGLLDVGEVLVADGHTLNFQILHPFTGKPCRMSMITWYDWASCMPVGWEIMPTENVQCVAAGLRRAILTLGKMPKLAYLDNGKAFKAKVFTDQDIDFEEAGFYGMFARLGIETIFAWPYNAQAKPVERFFGTFSELERLMPTFTGTSIDDKPAHMLRNEKLHRALHEKRYGGWIPTVEEANRIIAGWVGEYAKRPHRGLKGLQPGEVLAAGRGPGVDDVALRHLMMSMEHKPVHRNGIHFFGRNYYDDALYGMAEQVMVRYDLEDLSRVYVYDVTGTRLICEAAPVKACHPAAKITGRPEDLALVKAGIKQKRAHKRATEAAARAYVAGAPHLVELPRPPRAQEEGPGAGSPQPQTRRNAAPLLTQAEAEKIEADAAKMKVLELRPRQPDPVFMNEPERYEFLLERECGGEELELDEMQFMRYFEKTSLYPIFRERFEFLRELWLSGEEMAET